MTEPGGSPQAGPPPGPPGRPLPPARPAPRRSGWWLAIAGAVVLVATVGAVIAIAQAAGDGGDAAPDDPPTAGATSGDAAVTTIAPTPVRTAPAAPTDGLAFEHPDGSYTMTINPAWADMPSRASTGSQVWAIGQAEGGFTPNVNVLTAAAPDVGLGTYLDMSVEQLATVDAEVIEQALVQVADGPMLGLVRYARTPPGGAGRLEFLVVLDVRNGTAVVATLTSTADGFDALVADVEPYLFTLRSKE